jgi:hypothetical protein
MATIIQASTSSGLVYSGDMSGQLQFQTGSTATPAVTIDGSQNVKMMAGTAQILNSNGRPMLNQTGGILQVVQATSTSSYSTTSSTYSGTGVSVTITPSSTSSKILIRVTGGSVNNAGVTTGSAKVYRSINGGAYSDWTTTVATSYYYNGSGEGWGLSWEYLDSPATTSSVAYQIYIACGEGTFYLNNPPQTGAGNGLISMVAMEIAQ